MEGRGLKPYYLDTSLMLRLLTGDPPELAAQALEVFRGAEEGRYTLAVHPLAVAEAFYTLVSFYGVGRAKAAGALLDLLDREGSFWKTRRTSAPPWRRPGREGSAWWTPSWLNAPAGKGPGSPLWTASWEGGPG